MHHITRRLSPSLIVALVALFLALAGTAAASSVLGSNDARGKSKTAADETPRSLAAVGCETGNVLGFARVKGSTSVPNFYTSNSAVIDTAHNCTGSSVQVRRTSAGVYFVRFNDNAAKLALVTSNEDGASTEFSGDDDNIVTVGRINSGSDAGSFRVDVEDVSDFSPDGHRHQDAPFTIMIV
jgi:hypothetical protein